MKGVILAGGLGSRLYPLTKIANKHLLPIYDKPMIYYPIKTLVDSGIKEIMIIVSGPHVGQFLPVLRNGEEFGCKITYGFQDKPDGGIADALAVTEEFANGSNITVILGDNCTDATFKNEVVEFDKCLYFSTPPRAHLFYKEVPNPQDFGVVTFDYDNDIKEITEKPTEPASNYAVVGVYMYDKNVYNFIKQCKPSGRGQLEVTDINNLYLKNGYVSHSELKGFWSDAGTPDSLFKTNEYYYSKAHND
jgi:glucose-1-phosphate thymidylyltransferase